MAAVGALEAAVVAQLIDREGAATRANRLTLSGSPTDVAERGPGVLVRKAQHLRQGKGPGLGGEEEVSLSTSFASNMMTEATDAEMVMAERDWTAEVKGILRAEMARKHLSYKDLVEKLAAIGISETEANLRNKISRGGFTAVFLVQCLTAIGAHSLRLHEPE